MEWQRAQTWVRLLLSAVRSWSTLFAQTGLSQILNVKEIISSGADWVGTAQIAVNVHAILVVSMESAMNHISVFVKMDGRVFSVISVRRTGECSVIIETRDVKFLKLSYTARSFLFPHALQGPGSRSSLNFSTALY